MAKTSLTDMQRVILSGAAMRLDLKVLPIPKSLRKARGVAEAGLKALLSSGLIEEVTAKREDEVWRDDLEQGKLALMITAAGMEAIGVSSDRDGDGRSDEAQPVPAAGVAASPAPAAGPSSSGTKQPRDGSKLALLIETLKRPSGATIPDIMEATGWQAHSVRGAMSGALKKKLGLTIVSEVTEGRGRVYRIAPPASKDADDTSTAYLSAVDTNVSGVAQ